jgi:hypothetical protein
MTARLASVPLLLIIILAASGTYDAQAPRVDEDPGITGYVLAPDGTPVTEGTVTAQAATLARASIESTGHFRLFVQRADRYEFVISVPGFAPYRVSVTVPPSKSMKLPVIRLDPGVYVRVRLVTPEGEPITAPQLRRRMFDTSGRPIFGGVSDRPSDVVSSDGATMIGPLPRGVMTWVVDMPFFAQTRLPDVTIVDAIKMLDAGTITIQHPGAILQVDVTGETGAPVTNHVVGLEDVRLRSPLIFPPQRTDGHGRVTFDRLAAGRYRVFASATERCNGVWLTTSHVVPVSTNGTIETPLVVNGVALFHITNQYGPAKGVMILAAPTIPSSRSRAPGCRSFTDRDGRVTLTNFPPGPASIDIHMGNSTFTKQVVVPLDGQEISIAIPDGLLPVRVLNDTGDPIANATIAWTGAGARVETTVTATGDALLDSVGTGGGMLSVAARGYQPVEESLPEAPGVIHTVTLQPLARAATVRARVVTVAREPIRDALVELVPVDPSAERRIVVTNASGVVSFTDLPPGSLQLVARADGFVPSKISVPKDTDGEVVLTLGRGYRVMANVDLPAAAGQQVVRVTNAAGAAMDDVLDADSDRRMEPRGRLSLGPLAPGSYMIDLQGVSGDWQQRLTIVDRDLFLTFQ